MHERVRGALLRLSNTLPFGMALDLLERAFSRRRGVLFALTYHRVGDPADTPHLYPGLVTASAHELDAQLSMLRRRFDIVSLADVLEATSGAPLPPRPVLVTFDDAYADFLDVAWPMLRRHDVPVVLFTPTGLPDGDRRYWWDRLHHALASAEDGTVLRVAGGPVVIDANSRPSLFASLREVFVTSEHDAAMDLLDDLEAQLRPPPVGNGVLGWDSLRQLAGEGVDIGSHSHTHPVLPRLTRPRVDDELALARAGLDGQFGVGRCPSVFAYPGGFYNTTTVDAVRDAGFAVAFTSDEGGNRLATADRLRLRRIHVGGLSTPGVLRARMLPRSSRLAG